MIRILLLVLFLCGCAPDVPITYNDPIDYEYDPTYEDVVYVGDSNCSTRIVDSETDLSWYMAGIDSDCLAGRELMDITSLPEARIVFLALGTNDAWNINTTTTQYSLRLDQLLISTSAEVICVLPATEEGFTRWDVEPYRNIMLDKCTNTIDPLDYGVTVGYGDGYHWSKGDQLKFVDGIESNL